MVSAVEHVVDGDLTVGALGQPRRQLLGDLLVEDRQRIEDALCGLAGHDGPRRERQPLGGVARRHVRPGGLGQRLLVAHRRRGGLFQDLLGRGPTVVFSSPIAEAAAPRSTPRRRRGARRRLPPRSPRPPPRRPVLSVSSATRFGAGPFRLGRGAFGRLLVGDLLHLVAVLHRVAQILRRPRSRFASRTACNCSCGMSNSYSTRFLMRTAISESRPSSISGISAGRSSGA